VILLDTHVVLWAVTDDKRLGPASRKLIASKNRSDPYFVSSITAWEISLLVSRSRLQLGETAKNWFANAMKQPAWLSIGLDTETAIESANLPDEFHNDPADRFLVATARINGFALLTANQAILAYARAGYIKAIDASL
jgi:PIN domain nuclease of toxin-antitoxin system